MKKPGESKVVFYIIGVLLFIVLHKSNIKVSKRKVGTRPVRELGDLYIPRKLSQSAVKISGYTT